MFQKRAPVSIHVSAMSPTGDTYAKHFVTIAAAMKAVDPEIGQRRLPFG